MTTCNDCDEPVKRHGLFCSAASFSCESCDAELCKVCYESYPLVLMKGGNDNSSGRDKDLQKKAHIQSFCKSCFQRLSVLDFTKTYDVIESSANAKKSGVTFVFVHGGGGSRAMFRHHAQELMARHGHRCILLDLPGHGSLAEVELSFDTCWEELKNVLEENKIIQEEDGKRTNPKEKIVYVGGSLGAYVGFYLLDEFRGVFNSTVLMDCGQNVGPGRSFKASIGLHLLSYVAKHYSNKKLAKMMLDVTRKSPADQWVIESTFAAGWFFEQGEGQVSILRSVAPAKHIPELDIPICFMNGSKDHRDSEELWLNLCDTPDEVNSDLRVYGGGDHFFMHDSRFVEDVLKDIHNFAVPN